MNKQSTRKEQFLVDITEIYRKHYINTSFETKQAGISKIIELLVRPGLDLAETTTGLYVLGWAYMLMGRYSQGRENFRKAMCMRPEYWPARVAYMKASKLVRNDDVAKAA